MTCLTRPARTAWSSWKGILKDPSKSEVFSKYPSFSIIIMRFNLCATRCGWPSAVVYSRMTWTR